MKSGKLKIRKIKKQNKIYGFACAVLIAICFAFSTANYVYATDYTDEWLVSGWQESYFISNPNVQGLNLSSAGPFHGYNLFTFEIHEQYLNSNVNNGDTITGIFNSKYRVSLTTDYNRSLYTIQYDDLIIQSSYNTIVSTSNRTTVTNANGTHTTSFDLDIYTIVQDENYINSIDVDVICKYRWYFWNASSVPNLPSVQVVHSDYSSSFTSGSYGDSYVLQSIANMLQDLAFDDNVTILQSINDNLQIDDDVVDEQESRAYEISQINDSVDSAIASAAPDAVQEISAVGTMMEGHGTFWSAQQNAVSFWRDALNYAFDFSVVSYLATGLSIVLIIILFVFVLRL